MGTIPFSGTAIKLALDLRGNALYAMTTSSITRFNTQTRALEDTVTAASGQTFKSIWADNVNGNVYVTDCTNNLYYYIQPSPPSGVQYKMRFFGPSPVPGNPFSSNPFWAAAINNHGQALGYSLLTQVSYVNDCDGVTYKLFPGVLNRLRGINNNQLVSGWVKDSGGVRHPMVSDLNGNYLTVGGVGGPAGKLNDNGDTVGWWPNPTTGTNNYFLSRFDPNTMTYNFTDIPLTNGGSAYWLYDVNLADEAVGGEWFWDGSESVLHGIVYNNGTLTDVGNLGGTTFGTWLEGINNSGQAVGFGFTPDNIQHGLLYDDIDGLQDLGAYVANTELEGINDNGIMVGEEDDSTSSFALNAVIFDPSVGRMQDLNAMTDTSLGYLNGWSMGINNNNEILMNGAQPDGVYNWWMLEPVSNASLANLNLSPDTVAGGTSSTATVVLNSPAGSGGVVVSLTSDNPDAQIPSTATIAEGTFLSNVSVTTTAVSAPETAVITATYGNSSQAAVLYIGSPSLSSVSANPASLSGGASSVGTVTLSSVAPTGGVAVSISSSDPAAHPDSSVTVAAGNTQATFNITTSAVANDVHATISATQGAITVTTPLNISAPRIINSSINPSTVYGGTISGYTVYLNSPAPSGGIAIHISSSAPSVASTNATTSIGGTQGGNQINTYPVDTDTTVTFTFTYLDSTSTAVFHVKAAVLKQNTLNPGTVFGGSSSTGNVLLTSNTGPSGATVALSSSNPAVAHVPTTAIIGANQIGKSYTITTSPVSSTVSVQITATWKGVSKASTLTVKSPQLLSLGFQNLSGVTITTAKGLTYVKLKVSLNGPAPAGGSHVTLSSSNSAAIPVPSSTTVAAGATFSLIQIHLGRVTTNTNVTITSVFGGTTKTATFKVTP